MKRFPALLNGSFILFFSALCLLGSAKATAATDRSAQPGPPAGAAELGIGTYDIRDFGARGDGKATNTLCFQAAIDACATNGGGTVLVPGGVFLTGTVELKSNVRLYLAPTAHLQGVPGIENYRRGSRLSPGNGNYVLLYAADATNVTIEGRGTIDGDGANFYTGRGDGTGPRAPGSPAPTNSVNVDRPHLLVFERCENLLMRDLFLTRSAYHCVRILRCSYVHFDGIRIFNRINLNNDGFHFNSSQYVNIANCNIKCQDDACALFGSNQYFTIANCSFSTRWSVFRFGGGSPNHIAVANCLIYETYGCPIKFGGGDCSDMTFDNLIMRDVTGPISLTQGGGGRRGSQGGRGGAPAGASSASSGTNDVLAARPRGLRNISFSNIEATVVLEPQQQEDMPFKPGIRQGERNSCITLNAVASGIIENITFNNVHVTCSGGGTAEMGALRDVSTNTGEYFGIGVRPAYGFYARGVKGLTLQNVRLDTLNPDLRPAVVLDGVKDASVQNLTVQGDPGAESALRLVNTQDALITGARLLTPAPVFLAIEGSQSQNIKLDGGDFSKAAKPLTLSRGAADTAAKLRE
jgi:hypothetical protein